MMTDDKKDTLDPETRQTAEDLLRDRFRFIDLKHSVMQTLFQFGVEEVARDLAMNPERYEVDEELWRMSAGRPLKAQLRPLAPLELFLTEINLPALPKVLHELLRVMNDTRSSAKDLADVISLDTSLSSVVLRMANSAYYNFPFSIDTIARAVTLLGIQELIALAFSTSFLKMFRKSSSEFIKLEQFWKHSIACGIISRGIAKRCSMKNPERHFLAGLLHDIGRLALYSNLPESAGEAIALGYREKVSIREAEQTVFGFDHARFGGALLNKWTFPSTLVAAVSRHHSPDPGEGFEEPLTVHLADIIANTMGISANSRFTLEPLDTGTWDALELDAADLVPMVRELETGIESTFNIFIGKK